MLNNESSAKIYRIVVACGTAIATSTHVAIRLTELLQERGFKIHTTQCRVAEVPSFAPNADLVIATAQVPYDIEVPVVNGLPFLTGIGIEEVIDNIVVLLTNKG